MALTSVSYLGVLALTLVVEVPIFCLMLSRFARVPLSQALAAGVAVNVVSHPLFTFVLVPLVARVVPPIPAVLIGELIVCALEATMLAIWLRRDLPVVIAAVLIANGCSFAVGFVYYSVAQAAG